MKIPPVPPALLSFIREGSRFVVAGHMEPDGDCLGSQLALCSVLSRMGKWAKPYSAGPFKRTEIRDWAPSFSNEIPDEEKKGSKLIVLDCSTLDRLGNLASQVQDLEAASIDHHAAGAPFGSVQYIVPESPSTTLLVLALIEALGESPTKEEAQLLFFGFSTDTGFFRHLDEKSAPWFTFVSRLVEAGANPKTAFARMNGGKSLDSRKLLGIVLERTERHYNGKLLLSWEEMEETERFGLEGRDSDALYQLLQAVEGVEAIVVIRQESPERCTVGFRSRDRVDVSTIAASFGGGGHRQAAGLAIEATISSLKPRIIEAFEKQLAE